MNRFAISTALALTLAAPAAAQTTVPAKVATASATAPVVQMDHISIETVGNGTGDPVVLIPGMSMSRENWRPTADRIATDHTVYLVQLNGFGGSDPRANLKPGVMDGVIADLHHFIQQRGIGKVKLVGHSLGGTLALEMAERHPEDLSGVMLVDALPWVGLVMAPPTATPQQIEPQAAAMRDAVAARYGQPEDEAAAKRTIAMLALKPDSREQAYRWSRGADDRVMAQAYYEDMMADLRGGLADISVPVTLIYPWAASGASKEAADHLYRTSYADVPDMTFVDVGESGHFIMLDRPKAFDTALDNFLAG